MSALVQNKVLVGILVVILVVVAWFVLSSSSTSTPTLSSMATDGTTASSGDQNLVSTLLALRAVKLDATIFADPSFASLRDFSTQIVLEPAGRSDPFAAIVNTVATTTVNRRSDKIFTPQAR